MNVRIDPEWTIGEFSILTRLTVRALRFYHEKGIIVPVRIDGESGYRYYGLDQLERARLVKILRDVDFSVAEIAEVMTECREDVDITEFLERKAVLVKQEIDRFRRIAKCIEEMKKAAGEAENQVKTNINREITRKTLQGGTAVTLQYLGRYDEMGSRIGMLYRIAGRWAVGAVSTIYHDLEFKEEGADVEVCLAIKSGAEDTVGKVVARAKKGVIEGDILSVRTFDPQEVISLIHQGGYDTLTAAYEKLMDAIGERGLEIDGNWRDTYLKGPGMLFRGNPGRYLTEVTVPVKVKCS